MLLNDRDHPRVEGPQGDPGIRPGHAQIHVPEQLFPLGIGVPFLRQLSQDGVDLGFRKHRSVNPLHTVDPAVPLWRLRCRLGRHARRGYPIAPHSP